MMRSNGTADAAVGMMDGAYFRGRKEILDFLNELLCMSLTKIEQTATGAVACQLTEYIFPRSIPMSRVNWEAKASHDFIGNYKLLQAAFDKNRIQKYVDVDKLIRAKYQDNLEFCQWLMAFYEQAAPPMREDYDPLAVRAKGKGGKRLEAIFRPGGGEGGGGGGGGSRSATTRRHAAAPPGTTKKASPGGGAARTAPSRAQQKENQRPGGGGSGSTGSLGSRRQKSSSSDASSTGEAAVADAQLIKKNADLQTRNSELELTMKGIEQERDFYFEKLRGIEVMLQVHEERGVASDPSKLMQKIFKVLYATSDDNVEVTDEGELLSNGLPDEEHIGGDHDVANNMEDSLLEA